MADQQTSDISSAKLPNFVPFFNFVELMQRNSKLSTTLQAVGKEWSGFVQARLQEDAHLLKTLSECREFPSMQRAYMQFWEKALSHRRSLPDMQFHEHGRRECRATSRPKPTETAGGIGSKKGRLSGVEKGGDCWAG